MYMRKWQLDQQKTLLNIKPANFESPPPVAARGGQFLCVSRNVGSVSGSPHHDVIWNPRWTVSAQQRPLWEVTPFNQLSIVNCVSLQLWFTQLSLCACLHVVGGWELQYHHLTVWLSLDFNILPEYSCSVCRYREILVSMMDSILKKIQLRHNINELREIDDDTVDDDVSLDQDTLGSGHRFRTQFRTGCLYHG